MCEQKKTVDEIDYEGVERGSFDAFCHLVYELRSERGCPWDHAQTFETLKPCMIDELTEALAGIDLFYETGDGENLCEELGDVLLHIVLIAGMARDQGLFTMEDIIRGIGRKMLRRHPHVFGEDARRGWEAQQLEGLEKLPASWGEIKQLEKRDRTPQQQERQEQALARAAEQVIARLER